MARGTRAALGIGAVLATGVALAGPSGGLPSSAVAGACSDRTPTLVGTAGDDLLVGTDGDDVIHGLAGDDTLAGLEGSDVLCGGKGTDELLGGAGDDAMYGGPNGLHQAHEESPPDNVGDTLVPGAGDDHVDVGIDLETDNGGGFVPDTISFAASPQPVRVDLGAGRATGEGADSIVVEGRVRVLGTKLDDVLIGSVYDDELHGGEGGDLLRGLAGDDRLEADPYADDRRSPSPGDDQAYGGPGRDYLQLEGGDDLGHGGAGRDSFSKLQGRADILGGHGQDHIDTLLLFGGGQRIDGGPGRDEAYIWHVVNEEGRRVRARGRIDLGEGRIRIVLGDVARRSRFAGIERLRVPDGVWRVVGTAADERFSGAFTDWSRMLVRARGGDDVMTGTPGNDRLDGGRGSDRVSETTGRDVCISVERWYGAERCEVMR